MKIDAVELTLFAWDDIPPTKYTSGSQNQSGKSNLGLLTIKTDAGIEPLFTSGNFVPEFGGSHRPRAGGRDVCGGHARANRSLDCPLDYRGFIA